LADVAAASGVSLATVSRYRRGLRQPAAEVRARIDNAIQALGYRDNLVARSLATGRSGLVGLVLLDLGNPHFTRLAQAAHRVAHAQGFGLVLIDASESTADSAPAMQQLLALARRVDGIVVSARLPDDALAWLGSLGKPVVLFGRAQASSPQNAVHCVRSDGAEGARQLGLHLATLGHRHICFLSWPNSRWSAEREAALAQVCRDRGLRFSVLPVSASSSPAGESVAADVMFAPQPPDAVVAYNDLIAMGFLHAVQRLGFKVPQQVSIAGFDDIPAAAYLSPTLTTVSLHSDRQGGLAMQRLLALIGSGPRHAPPPSRLDMQDATRTRTAEDIVPPSLMVRGSTRRL
jgi:LacI family transcriptional regulator